jgi:NTE family protein
MHDGADDPVPPKITLATPRDPFRGTRVRIALAFEGGGAKGAVHVGALQAIEQAEWGDGVPAPTAEPYCYWPRYEVCAVAGASIGGLVAALVAAGYRSQDMRPETRGATPRVLQNAGVKSALSLFGRGGWRRIRRLRDFGESPSRFLLWFAFQRLLLWVMVAYVVLASVPNPYVSLGLLAAGLVVHGWQLARSFQAVLFGLCSPTVVADAVNRALSHKVFGPPPESPPKGFVARAIDSLRRLWRPCRYVRRVTFADLRLPLAIVATDIHDQTLYSFSRNATGDAIVAEAVAASTALPIIFQAAQTAKTGKRLFYDGGLISNIPSWSFDAERGVDPDLYTISVHITNPKLPDLPDLSLAERIRRLLFSAIFGGQSIEKRFTRDVAVLTVPQVRLLEFDMSESDFNQAVKEGKSLFEATMTRRAAWRFVMDQIGYNIASLVAEELADPSSLAEGQEIRVSFLQQLPNGGPALRRKWRYSSSGDGFQGHGDDRILWPIAESLPGTAWHTSAARAAHTTVGGGFDPTRLIWDAAGSADRDKLRYVKDLLWKSQWVFAVPVVSNQPKANNWVVLIETNIPYSKFKFGHIDDLIGGLDALIEIISSPTVAAWFWQLDRAVAEQALRMWRETDESAIRTGLTLT